MPTPNIRRSGVLLHPTSFPSPWGIGDLGQQAFDFIRFLHETRQQLWQILPLGPTGENGSPYSAYSSVAGNPLLISIELLVEDGILADAAAPGLPASSQIDFARVFSSKLPVLEQAFEQFDAGSQLSRTFEDFCDQQREWLDSYALFMALKDRYPGKAWNAWPRELAARQPQALDEARRANQQRVAFHQFTQFVFYRQWSRLKKFAHQQGIRVVGDIPFYVAHDSADVWANPENFAVDKQSGESLLMAGVPPDYFSKTGQLWGNPVFDWENLEEEGFQWWIKRFAKLVELVDIVRIDHFRGFQAYWQVPHGETTAVNGKWVECPGDAFFHTLEHELGHLPIWAEDLGVITADVEKLRDDFQFPGMKVLQFAFDDTGAANPYLPFHFSRNCVCYTGTHDNDTTMGWWEKMDADQKSKVLAYLGREQEEAINWALIRLAMGSVANSVVFPLQDILGSGSDARMNVPGQEEDNWSWRYDDADLDDWVKQRLLRATEVYGRAPKKKEKPKKSATAS